MSFTKAIALLVLRCFKDSRQVLPGAVFQQRWISKAEELLCIDVFV